MPRLGGLELLDPRLLPLACAARSTTSASDQPPASRVTAATMMRSHRLGQQDEEDGGRRGQHKSGNGSKPGTGTVLLEGQHGGLTRVAPGPAGYNPGGAVPMVGRMVEVAPVADETDERLSLDAYNETGRMRASAFLKCSRSRRACSTTPTCWRARTA